MMGEHKLMPFALLDKHVVDVLKHGPQNRTMIQQAIETNAKRVISESILKRCLAVMVERGQLTYKLSSNSRIYSINKNA